MYLSYQLIENFGEVTFIEKKHTLSSYTKRGLTLLFWLQKHHNKNWAIHISCNKCTCNIVWLSEKKCKMPFTVSMTLRQPNDYVTNCYFCLTPPTQKACDTINNPPYVRCPKVTSCLYLVHVGSVPENVATQAPIWLGFSEQKPTKISRNKLSNFIRDLELTKIRVDLLVVRLQ